MTAAILDRIREGLGEALRDERQRSDRRMYFDIDASAVEAATQS